VRLPLFDALRDRFGWGQRTASLPLPPRDPELDAQAEIAQLKRRIHAMQCERTEAISNALLFENSDITNWLQTIAATDKGALGVRVMELEAEVRALRGPVSKIKESEAKAWATVDKVLEAWDIAAGLRGWGRWDEKTEQWVVDQIEEQVLPATVVKALKEWLVSQRPKPRK